MLVAPCKVGIPMQLGVGARRDQTSSVRRSTAAAGPSMHLGLRGCLRGSDAWIVWVFYTCAIATRVACLSLIALYTTKVLVRTCEADVTHTLYYYMCTCRRCVNT